MGHKVHPVGFRLGIIRDWQARWFADKPRLYRKLILEDLQIRKIIHNKYAEGTVARVEVERGSEVVISVNTARPGIVIGRGGQRIEELRQELEAATGKRVRVNVVEVRQPELEAALVARAVADQLERRVAYRRAMKLAVQRTLAAGGQGIKIVVSGRLGGAEIARTAKDHQGRVPLHTIRADIDFARSEAHIPMGRIGVKVWINRGEILPEKETELEPQPVEAAVPSSTAEGSQT